MEVVGEYCLKVSTRESLVCYQFKHLIYIESKCLSSEFPEIPVQSPGCARAM